MPILVPAALVTAVLAVVAVMVFERPPRGDVPSLAEWKEPTAFLLRTPGHELLSGTPAFHETRFPSDHPSN